MDVTSKADGVPSAEGKLEAVISGAHLILEKRSFPDSARAIFDKCRKLTGAVSGYVALLSNDGRENEVLFLEAGGMPCDVDPSLPMPIRGLRAIAYQTHRATYENDFANSPWATYMPQGHVAMRNVLFAPLNLDESTVGVIGLANKPGDFTQEDAEIVSVLGELAAIALANSRQLDLLQRKTDELRRALSEVHTLRGLLPMCARCHKIRDDEGLWTKVEEYITQQTDARVSHGLCPDCMAELYGDQADSIRDEPSRSGRRDQPAS